MGEPEPPPPPEMTVNAGPEHDGLGADVRVTNSADAVVVGHDSQMTVEAVSLSAATHVYAWRAVEEDISFCHGDLGVGLRRCLPDSAMAA